MSLKLIVGLGNPGRKYRQTRHNVGFMCLDSLAEDLNIKFKTNKRLNCDIAEIHGVGRDAILIKPTTYMNLSGTAVIKLMNYYKIELNDLLVIVDDLDLETGKVRIRERGGSGGHNGLKSIMQHIKDDNFKRIRIGISKEGSQDAVNHVLGKFSKEEITTIQPSIHRSVQAAKQFIRNIPFHEILSLYNQ